LRRPPWVAGPSHRHVPSRSARSRQRLSASAAALGFAAQHATDCVATSTLLILMVVSNVLASIIQFATLTESGWTYGWRTSCEPCSALSRFLHRCRRSLATTKGGNVIVQRIRIAETRLITHLQSANQALSRFAKAQKRRRRVVDRAGRSGP
jgi:hypothetical protein